MKIGIIISLIIIVLLGSMTFFLLRGFPDEPTRATAPDTLKPLMLPSDLPPVFNPTSEGDATELYNQALRLFADQERQLLSEDPPENTIKRLAQLLTEARDKTGITHGWLDNRIPIAPNALPEYGVGLQAVMELVYYRANDLYDAGDEKACAELMQAVWALAQRSFTHNERLAARSTGMQMMEWCAGPMTELSDHLPVDNSEMRRWLQFTREGGAHFQSKKEIVLGAKPHMGDLLNIAQNDQDPTFRIEAVLRLGVMKFNPGNTGNLRVLNGVLAEAKSSDNPQIAEAGEVADAMTLEEMRRLN